MSQAFHGFRVAGIVFLFFAVYGCSQSDTERLDGPMELLDAPPPRPTVVWMATSDQMLRCQDTPWALRRAASSNGASVLVVVVEARGQPGLAAATGFLRAERISAEVLSVDGTKITRDLWDRLPILAVLGSDGVLYEGNSFDPRISGEMLDVLSQSSNPHWAGIETNPQGR